MKRLMLQSCAFSMLAVSTPSIAQSVSGGERESAVDDIIVTAQRRSERLQDVPVAVTALDAGALSARQINNIVDIMAAVPNLHASSNLGQGSATTAFLRGVGETESIIAIDSPVGFYVDDVYIGRQGVNNVALFDVDRIEVLRGPQGTLYGRNTSAGAIKVITKRPEFEDSGLFEASYGRFDAISAKSSINISPAPDFAIRANALVSGGGGYNYNRFLDKRVNDTKFFGFRVAGRYKPSSDLDINISGDYSRGNEQGTYGVDIAGKVRPTSGSYYISTSGTDTTNIGKAWGGTATVDYTIDGNSALKSITAYRRTDQKYNLDFTDQPISLLLNYTNNRSRQFSQELQVLGDAFSDKLSYVAGLFFFDESSTAALGSLTAQRIYVRRDLKVNTKSYAAFVQASYHITDKLGLILGGRYTRDDKSIDETVKSGGTPGFADIGGVFVFDNETVRGQIIAARPGRPVKTDLRVGKFTPKIGLEFKPTEQVLLYASYTQGFKSGGWSARVSAANQFFDFDPETVNSYEVGVKSSLLDRKATVNVTGFYYDYKNLFNTGTTSTAQFGIATSNARIYGVEVETNFQIADGIRLFANGAHQQAKRLSINTATIALGSELQRLPHWSGSVGVNARRPLFNGIDLLGNVDYSRTGTHFINPQNTVAGRVGPVDLFNGSVGIATQDNRYALTLGCRNCLGEVYITQILDFSTGFGIVQVYPGPRSTWKLTATARF